MPTRNVVLSEHQVAFIGDLLASGRYQNASEVLRTGLRLLEQREAEDAARLAALRQAVSVGIADLGAGRFDTLERVAELDGYLAAIDRTSAADDLSA
jgi:antitoxin ParD1/3/4